MIRGKSDFCEVRLCGKLCVNFYSVAMMDSCIDFWPSFNFLLQHEIKLVLRFKAGCIFFQTHCTKTGFYMCRKAKRIDCVFSELLQIFHENVEKQQPFAY